MGSYRGSLRIAATNDVIDALFVVDEDELTVTTGEETLGRWPLAELSPDDTGTHVLLALDGERVVIDVPDHSSFVAALDNTDRKRKRRRGRKRKQDRTAKAKRPAPTKPKKGPRVPRRRPEGKPTSEPIEEAAPERTPVADATIDREPASVPEPVVEAEPVVNPEPVVKPEPVVTPEPAATDERAFLPKPDKRAARRFNPADTIRKLLDRDTWEEWLSDRVVLWALASTVVIVVALLALFATNSLGMILVLLGMVVLVVVALAVSEDLTAYSWIPGNLSETTLVIAGVSAMVVGGLLILIG